MLRYVIVFEYMYIYIMCMYFYIYIIYSHIYMSFHKVKKYGRVMNSSRKHGLPYSGQDADVKVGREGRQNEEQTDQEKWVKTCRK